MIRTMVGRRRRHRHGDSTNRQFPFLALVFGGVVTLTLYQESRISAGVIQIFHDRRTSDDIWTTPTATDGKSEVKSPNRGFGACILFKDDNHNLREWISYHYLVLPLTHVLVGVDHDSIDNPNDVLIRWNDVAINDFTYKVVNISEFISIHKNNHFGRPNRTTGNSTTTQAEQFTAAHELLKQKQRAFITYCSKYMLSRPEAVVPGWISMWDTDEYLVINRITSDEEAQNKSSSSNNSKNNTKNTTTEDSDESPNIDIYGLQRPALPVVESSATVLDIIDSWKQSNLSIDACHCLPRVTFGADETYQCPESTRVRTSANQNGIRTVELNTIRYHQHAKVNNFDKNKWGKIMMNVRNLPKQIFETIPNNIHRPYKSECPRPVRAVEAAPFVLMHHIGSWEQYTRHGRDLRRTRTTWEDRAFVNESTSFCSQQVHRWLPRFIAKVGGIENARYLLSSPEEN